MWLRRMRRAGVGRDLSRGSRECAVVAVFSVALEARAGNDGAQLFYERIGYRTLVFPATTKVLRRRCAGADICWPAVDHKIRARLKVRRVFDGLRGKKKLGSSVGQ